MSSTKANVYSDYEKALATLHKGSFAAADKQFEKIEQAFPAELEVLARVRVFRRLCQRRIEGESQPKSAGNSAEDLFNLGVFLHNNGEYAQAADSFAKALKQEDSDYVHYAMAATEARRGNSEVALSQLKVAIEMNSENRFFAANDPDFLALSENRDFRKLLVAQT